MHCKTLDEHLQLARRHAKQAENGPTEEYVSAMGWVKEWKDRLEDEKIREGLRFDNGEWC